MEQKNVAALSILKYRQKYFFTTPTIAYSSSRAYSLVYTFHSDETNRTYQTQLVLQCRQMPNTF
ncbi:hypothetical protein I4U23_010507 [Adineta vaga]|nr:hypothetical protein I4U23_010507 [Adineta vaga]